jgi:sulfite reductase (ferredoxin)
MTTFPEPGGRALVDLGAGMGSGVERIKLESRQLHGQIAQELAEDTSRFSEDQAQLIKFHGIYQQEDRDARQARKAAGVEKAYNFMVRSRIPGGALSAAQYLAQDELAGRFANSTLRITTRQGLQLHGVLKGDLHPTLAAINRTLLSTLAACGDVNRNVMACPAPVTSRAQAQVQEIAHRIAMHLAPHSTAYHEIWVDGEQVQTVEAPRDGAVEPIYGATYLPRKFKIGVAFPGDNCVDLYTQDIGLVATLRDEELAGFTLLIGGGMGMTHGKGETFPRLATPLCFASPGEVLAVVEGVVTIQRDFGDRTNRKHARMKYLVEERGIAWFRAELERRLGRVLRAPRPVAWRGVDDHLGWHRQADGRWFLGLWVENGRIKDAPDAQFRTGLRAAVAAFGPGIRLTGQQNLLLTDIAEEQREALAALLARHGIAADAATLGGVRRHAMACPALPTCGLALADAERALPMLVRQVEAELAELGLAGERLSIRMTGCPNGCARPYMGDIGLVGKTKDVYNIYVGGDWANTRLNALFAASVHVTALTSTLRPLLVLWKDGRVQDETLGDFCHRVGIEALRAQVEDRYGT